jgi:hypothetical protein
MSEVASSSNDCPTQTIVFLSDHYGALCLLHLLRLRAVLPMAVEALLNSDSLQQQRLHVRVGNRTKWLRAKAARVGSSGETFLFLACPSLPLAHYSLVFQWARVARAEMARQYCLRNRMAVVMTLGGGWASLKRAPQALLCALELYSLAEDLGDESTMRKCKIFVGWAHLWAGNVSTSHDIFLSLLSESHRGEDSINLNRCHAALLHLEHLGKTKSRAREAAGVTTDVLSGWERIFLRQQQVDGGE